MRVYVATFARFTADAGSIVTVGAIVSFPTVVEAWTAGLPARSEWSAVIERAGPSAAALTSKAAVAQVLPPVQVGVSGATPATVTVTTCPGSEQVPVRVYVATFARLMSDAGSIVTVGIVLSII